MLGEVALSKLTYNALAVRRAFPTIVYIQTPIHHITLEKLSACTSTVHAENYSTHIIQLMCYVSYLVGNLELQGKPDWCQALGGCYARRSQPLLRIRRTGWSRAPASYTCEPIMYVVYPYCVHSD